MLYFGNGCVITGLAAQKVVAVQVQPSIQDLFAFASGTKPWVLCSRTVRAKLGRA